MLNLGELGSLIGFYRKNPRIHRLKLINKSVNFGDQLVLALREHFNCKRLWCSIIFDHVGFFWKESGLAPFEKMAVHSHTIP